MVMPSAGIFATWRQGLPASASVSAATSASSTKRVKSFIDSNSAASAMRPVNIRSRMTTGPSRCRNKRDVAEHRAEEARRGHADFRLSGRDDQIGRQRQLKAQSQCVGLELDNCDLRKADELVEHPLALAVDGQAPPLTGPPVITRGAVPPIGPVQVDAGGEHATFATHDHDLDGVVVGDVVEEAAHQLAILGRHRILLLRIGDRDPRDMAVVVLLQSHSFAFAPSAGDVIRCRSSCGLLSGIRWCR